MWEYTVRRADLWAGLCFVRKKGMPGGRKGLGGTSGSVVVFSLFAGP